MRFVESRRHLYFKRKYSSFCYLFVCRQRLVWCRDRHLYARMARLIARPIQIALIGDARVTYFSEGLLKKITIF